MQIDTLQVGALQTNCYVVRAADGSAALVDPGDDADRIIRHVRTADLTVKGIWLTHGHYDHIGAVNALKQVFDCPVTACRSERMLLQDARMNLSLLFIGRPLTVTADRLYDDGDTFEFGGETVEVLHTPGHTSGSCCYRIGDILLSGDTLFQNSIGRTDFPTGDVTAMMDSLRRLSALEGDCTVLSGHGPATLLSTERKYNPYLGD